MSVSGPTGVPMEPLAAPEIEEPPPPPPPETATGSNAGATASSTPTAPPQARTAGPFGGLEAQLLARDLDGAGGSIPSRIRSLLEYGVVDYEVTDDDIGEVLNIMQPMEIGGEWDDVILAMAETGDPCLLDRLVHNVCEEDMQGQLDRFVGWATDGSCRPETKAAIMRALAREADDGNPRAAAALARILRSNPPGAALGAIEDGDDLAAVARAVVASGELGSVLEALPPEQAERLRGAVGQAAAERFRELLPDSGKIIGEMEGLPFGPWDAAIAEMAGRPTDVGATTPPLLMGSDPTDLDVFVFNALTRDGGAGWAKMREWLADPKCDPATKQHVLESLAKIAQTNVPPSDAWPVSRDFCGQARDAIAQMIEDDPQGFAALAGANPALLMNNPALLDAAGRALTPEMLGTMIAEMKKTGEGLSIPEGEKALIGHLFQKYIASRGGDGKAIEDEIARFMAGAADAGLMNNPKDFAAVAGGLIAGLKLHAKARGGDVTDFANLVTLIGAAVSLVAGGPGVSATTKTILGAIGAGLTAGRVGAGYIKPASLDDVANKICAGIMEALMNEEEKGQRPAGFAQDADIWIRVMIGSAGRS